jgi:predicted DNA-binding transcriptional regulator AlpA
MKRWRTTVAFNDGLPESGFVRLRDILAPHGPIPVSKSTWWAGVGAGRYPKPVKLGPRITAWRVEDIRKLVETGAVVGR